jgi:ABC-type antimicrobial peptide transport system permease subunit
METPSTQQQAAPALFAAQVENVSKVYGSESNRIEALSNVTIGIDRGKFTAIMGPSCSGKSTLMHVLAAIFSVFSVISGFSALLAAIGMVNNLSLSVLQRIRELGLLRALGFTARQIRTMIVAESAQLTITAVLVGLLLGTFYGWPGAEAMLGSARGAPGLIWPAFPLMLIAVIVVGAAALTWLASVAPTRRATRVTPVDALAVE